MIPDSYDFEELARKNEAALLRSLALAGQANVASKLEIHESSVSRWKSDGSITKTARSLAAMGLKVLEADSEAIRREDLAALVHGTQEWAQTLSVAGLVERAKE